MSERFNEGDRLNINGHEYVVVRVSTLPFEDVVIHYDTQPVDDDAPPVTVKPTDNDEQGFVVVTYDYPDELEVIERA